MIHARDETFFNYQIRKLNILLEEKHQNSNLWKKPILVRGGHIYFLDKK